MYIPPKLQPLLKELAAEHWLQQLLQVRRFGVDHPQAKAMTEHLDAARELAKLSGVDTEVA
jgi:hypothetical protein